MSAVSHQTIRLSPGSHSSSTQGACVMELASMLAGEPFTDHPACVCPIISSFLRAYNDYVGDERRQELLAYAAMVVDSRVSPKTEQRRADHLMRWSAAMLHRGWTRFLPRPAARAVAKMRRPPLQRETLGIRAVCSIPKRSANGHAAALALIEELLAIADPPAHAEVLMREEARFAAPGRTSAAVTTSPSR